MRKRELVAMLAKAQGGKCALCLRASESFHVDHIVPRSAGGFDGIPNLQALCPPCNRTKHDHCPPGTQYGLWDRPMNVKSSRYDRPGFDINAYWRERRALRTKALRAAGMCTMCGKERVDGGRATCHPCGAKANARAKRRKIAAA